MIVVCVLMVVLSMILTLAIHTSTDDKPQHRINQHPVHVALVGFRFVAQELILEPQR